MPRPILPVLSCSISVVHFVFNSTPGCKAAYGQGHQTEINTLANQVEKHIKPFPGFISASFHVSEDGKRVINYAQLRSRESYKSFIEADPAETRKIFDRYVQSMRSDHPLSVEHVIEKEEISQ